MRLPYAYLVLYEAVVDGCDWQQLEAQWADSTIPKVATLVDWSYPDLVDTFTSSSS